MSPNTANSLVHDLVEMAKAMEQLPIVIAERDAANNHNSALANTVATREETILRLKAEIESLQQAKRSLEVERDAAQFQVLEEQERLQGFLSFVKGVSSNASSLIASLQPEVKLLPIDEHGQVEYPEAKPEEGQSVPDPTANSPLGAGASSGNAMPSENVESGTNASSPASSGQRDVGEEASTSTPIAEGSPTGGATTTTNAPSPTPDGSHLSVPSQSVTSSGTAISQEPSPVGEFSRSYANNKYSEIPYFVKLEDWLANGGTEESYYR